MMLLLVIAHPLSSPLYPLHSILSTLSSPLYPPLYPPLY
jgi:hypothetical protein